METHCVDRKIVEAASIIQVYFLAFFLFSQRKTFASRTISDATVASVSIKQFTVSTLVRMDAVTARTCHLFAVSTRQYLTTEFQMYSMSSISINVASAASNIIF